MYNLCWFECIAAVAHGIESLLLQSSAINAASASSSAAGLSEQGGHQHATAWSLMSDDELEQQIHLLKQLAIKVKEQYTNTGTRNHH